MEKKLILYTGPNCHLCEQAKAILYSLLDGGEWSLQEVNIEGDPGLQEKYGIRIPVIVTPNGDEKGWPFTAGQVKRLLGS